MYVAPVQPAWPTDDILERLGFHLPRFEPEIEFARCEAKLNEAISAYGLTVLNIIVMLANGRALEEMPTYTVERDA